MRSSHFSILAVCLLSVNLQVAHGQTPATAKEPPPGSVATPKQANKITALAASGKLTAQSLYPLVEGSTWTYDMNAAKKKLVMKTHIAKIEKIDEQTLPRLETSINGQITSTEHFISNSKGLYRARYNGVEIVPPLQLLANPVKIGVKSSQKVKFGDQEMTVITRTDVDSIKTPIGKLDTVKLSIATVVAGVSIDSDFWLAPDIGMVRQSLSMGDTEVEVEIKKFEPGKAESL